MPLKKETKPSYVPRLREKEREREREREDSVTPTWLDSTSIFLQWLVTTIIILTYPSRFYLCFITIKISILQNILFIYLKKSMFKKNIQVLRTVKNVLNETEKVTWWMLIFFLIQTFFFFYWFLSLSYIYKEGFNLKYFDRWKYNPSASYL